MYSKSYTILQAGKQIDSAARRSTSVPRANGTVVHGTRAPYSNAIGSDGYFAAMGNSNYNALQLTLKRTKGPLTLLASYSFSKSLDWSSNLQEQVNP